MDINLRPIFSSDINMGRATEQEVRFIFQNVWTEGTIVIYKTIPLKRCGRNIVVGVRRFVCRVTKVWIGFVFSPDISLVVDWAHNTKLQSNKRVPKLFDCYAVKTTSGNGQAWSLPTLRGQKRTGKNGGNWW